MSGATVSLFSRRVPQARAYCQARAPGRGGFEFSARHCALLIAGLMVGAGCSKTDPTAPPGDLQSPTASAAVGDYVFFTAPNQDGLRAALVAGSVAAESCSDDTDCGSGQACTEGRCIRSVEEVLRAPNPIFSLLVPALRMPGLLTALPADPARDQTRNLLLVASQVDPQLRVIDADVLTPVGRAIALPGRAVGLEFGASGRLFVAIEGPSVDPGQGLPSGDTLVEVQLEQTALQSGKVLGRSAGQVISNWPLGDKVVGLALADGPSPRVYLPILDEASMIVLEPDTGVRQPVAIPEALGLVHSNPPTAEGSHLRGERLFGSSLDGRKLYAFEGSSGEVVAQLQDADGVVRPMLFPTAVSEFCVGDSALITLPGQENASEIQWPLAIAAVDGVAYLADGLAATPLDGDGDGVATPRLDTMTPEQSDRSAPRLAQIPNPNYDATDPSSVPTIPELLFTAGVTRSRSWAISYRPPLPQQDGVLGLLSQESGTLRLTPARPWANLEALVKANDEVELLEAPGACGDIAAIRYKVISVLGPESRLVLGPLGEAPVLADPSCADTALRYRVRASGFIVTASGLGQILRATPGELMEFTGAPFLATHDQGPELSLRLDADQSGLAVGATRLLSVFSGADPWRIDAKPLVGNSARMPGVPTIAAPLSLGGAGAKASGRVYLPFPDYDAVFAFDLNSGAGETLLR